MSETVRQDYLAAADSAAVLLRRPEVAAQWDGPSALADFSVGGLACHLGLQVTGQVRRALDAPTDGREPTPLLEHYGKSAWVGADLDAEVNVGIRQSGERTAAEGVEALCAAVDAALAELRSRLPAEPADRVVLLSWSDRALRLDHFLATRVMELAVHSDDLAVSVGLETPELPQSAVDTVVDLLSRLAVRRHGSTAVLRALSRAERAPSTIAAL